MQAGGKIVTRNKFSCSAMNSQSLKITTSFNMKGKKF